MTKNRISANSISIRSLCELLFQCFICLLICNRAIAQVSATSIPPNIQIIGDVIHYKGALNTQGTTAVTPLIESGQYKTLRIRSPGGDIIAAMDFGILIFDYGLNVVVDKHCSSSCANYIFPAGKHKTIEQGSLVMWHGDARQRNFLEELKKLEARAKDDGMSDMTNTELIRLKYRRHSITAQDGFYKKIGIDGSIARIGQEIDLPVKQWVMSAQIMGEFGISNIEAPPDYGTKEYCQRWVAARYSSTVRCLDLTSNEIDSWRKRPTP